MATRFTKARGVALVTPPPAAPLAAQVRAAAFVTPPPAAAVVPQVRILALLDPLERSFAPACRGMALVDADGPLAPRATQVRVLALVDAPAFRGTVDRRTTTVAIVRA